jgi:hypothetical protein
MTSLAKSLARSGDTKQEKPDRATPASYILMLQRSCIKIRENIRYKLHMYNVPCKYYYGMDA